MKKQTLAIAVLSGLLSIPAFAAPEAKPAVPAPARAPAAPAPAPAAPVRTPAPAPAPNNARPSPSSPPANNTAPARTPIARPNQTPAPNQTPHSGNDQGRAPGSIQPLANAEEAHQRLTENQQRTGRKGEGRHHHNFDRGQFRGNYLGGYLPYAWWYNGDTYWSRPYNDFDYNDNQLQANNFDNNTTPPPAAPDNTGPTPAQDQAKATNQLEGTPSYRQAVAELAKAQAAYDAASAKALEKLKHDPKYKELVQRRDQAEDKVEAVQASARIPSPAQVTPAAQKKLDLSSQITRMEQNAIANDPDAAAAKNKVIDLNAQVQTLKRQAQNAGQQ